MTRPRLLDLFCGAGGAAMGYARAGFEVVGVDIKPQPHYPFEFHQGDAMAILEAAADGDADPLDGALPAWSLFRFDAIHASPPCQRYSSATRDASKHPDLYEPTRQRLAELGVPWVIENVIGAPYGHGVVLCGSMFGLEAEGEWLQRHRNFEASQFMWQPECQHRKDRRPITITGQAYLSATREYGHSRQTTYENAQRLMGIDWMSRDEMKEAIPPAYTEWIGRQLLTAIPRERCPVTKQEWFAVARLARRLHERDCPNDGPYDTRSIAHRYVHEGDALRQFLARKRSASGALSPSTSI